MNNTTEENDGDGVELEDLMNEYHFFNLLCGKSIM